MVSTVKRIIMTNIISIFLLLAPHNLFALGSSERPVEIRVITELQDRYNALDVPAMIMLPIAGTSAVPADLLGQIEKELSIQLVNAGKVKPVVMQKWLLANYGSAKANNPFVLINAIKAEHYVVPVQYIGKASIFKSENKYVFMLNIYPVATYYPITILRIFNNTNETEAMLASCLDEMNIRLFQPTPNDSQKRVIIDKFRLELVKLIELETGEFEYISAPFIEHNGVPVRDGDDYFSGILGYVLATTNLFRPIRPAEFSEYTNSTGSAAYADYYIRGRVQVSEKECILYLDLQDLRTGANIAAVRHPLTEYSLEIVWNAYRDLSHQIISAVFDKETFGVVPTLSAPNRGFFMNNMFIGWETLENFILAKGLHIISTGSYYRAFGSENSGSMEIAGNNQKTNISSPSGNSRAFGAANAYFVLVDFVTRIYTDRDGEHIWNLLRKQGG